METTIASAFASSDEDKFTHIHMVDPPRKIALLPEGTAAFWSDYVRKVAEGHNPALFERPHPVPPLILEGTFHFAKANARRGADLLTESFILHLTQVLQNLALARGGSSDVRACVTVSKYPDTVGQGDVLTSTLRIQLPRYHIDAQTQRNIARAAAERAKEDDLFGYLPCRPIRDWSEEIDIDVSSRPLALYGSSAGRSSPLELFGVYERITEDHMETGEPPEADLGDLFNPAEHLHVAKLLLSERTVREGSLRDWLPLLLSGGYAAPRWVEPHEEKPTQRARGKDPTKLDICRDLLPLLGDVRWSQRHYWEDIGRCLYNTTKGSEEGLGIWYRASRERTPKEWTESCETIYATYERGNCLSVRTIAWYARMDSPEKYRDWHKKWYEGSIIAALSLAHTDVAEAFRRMFWLEFACSSIEKKTTYVYTRHSWEQQDAAHKIRRRISHDFRKRFETLRTELSSGVEGCDDPSERDRKEAQVKRATTLIDKLKNVTYKGPLVHEIIESIRSKRFVNNRDRNPALLGLINGVVECTGHEAIFRPGKPEDFITITSQLKWRDGLSWEHPNVQKYMEWVDQCFIERDLVDFFLKFESSLLMSGNIDKIFLVLSGPTDSSKSTHKRLNELVLGQRSVTMSNEVFSQSGRAHGPTPELARAATAKVVWVQEPDEEEAMRNGRLKAATGADRYPARFLHENGGEFEALFKLVLMCNKIPLIPGADKAIKHRLVVCPCLSSWVDDPPNTEEERRKQRKFQRNVRFDERLPLLAPAALWVWVQYYARYCKEGLWRPEAVKRATRTYWAENDIYELFAESKIQTIEGAEGRNFRLLPADVYPPFRRWFSERFPNLNVPDVSAVVYELDQRWGARVDGAWLGRTLTEST